MRMCVREETGYKYTDKFQCKEHVAVSVIFLVHCSKNISSQMLPPLLFEL